MSINKLRELDIFGTEIKWRLKSKDNFKSIFGALITLLLAGLFIFKLLLFILKSYEYGFAKNKISNEYKGKFQLLNMSDWRMIVQSNLDDVLNSLDHNTQAFINKRSYMNLSDFIDVSAEDFSFHNQQLKLWPIETDCAKDPKVELVEVTDEVWKQARYKCFTFNNSYNFLNLTYNETVLEKANGKESKYQHYRLPQFLFRFEMKETLRNLLNSTKGNISLSLMFYNYKLNPSDFTLQEYYLTFPLIIDLKSQLEIDINFKKISVSKKYEFDFYEYEFSNEHKYVILEDSLQYIKSPRNNKDVVIDYFDTLSFNLMLFEENNDVTFLTLDDILAVLGGFMQIVFAAAQLLAGLYNEKNAERIIWRYCNDKYCNYETTIKNVRRDIDLQMDYYEKMYSRRKNECDVKSNSKKFGSDVNYVNIDHLNFNSFKLNNNGYNSNNSNNKIFYDLSKNKNDGRINDRKLREQQHSVKAYITDININGSHHDYLNKINYIKDNIDKENENFYRNDSQSNENIKTKSGGNTQYKKDYLQQSGGVSDKLKQSINNLRKESVGEEYFSNEKRIAQKVSENKYNPEVNSNNNIKGDKTTNSNNILKDFSNQLFELNNINNKKLLQINKNKNLFKSDDNNDLKNYTQNLNKTDYSMKNNKGPSTSKNFDDSKSPLGISSTYCNTII